ncbi:hypothetical protein ACJX0J_016994, partial [Zea mays]
MYHPMKLLMMSILHGKQGAQDYLHVCSPVLSHALCIYVISLFVDVSIDLVAQNLHDHTFIWVAKTSQGGDISEVYVIFNVLPYHCAMVCLLIERLDS